MGGQAFLTSQLTGGTHRRGRLENSTGSLPRKEYSRKCCPRGGTEAATFGVRGANLRQAVERGAGGLLKSLGLPEGSGQVSKEEDTEATVGKLGAPSPSPSHARGQGTHQQAIEKATAAQGLQPQSPRSGNVSPGKWHASCAFRHWSPPAPSHTYSFPSARMAARLGSRGSQLALL